MISNIAEPAATAEKPLVLIVDDVLENRSSAQRRLERMGYACLQADSGSAALHLLDTVVPAVILLDFMMPEMSGLSVLRQLRASTTHASTPVIMLTARTDSEAVVASLNEGANDYVHKPIDFPALKARIDTHVEQQRKTRALVDANTRMDTYAVARAIELGEVRGLLHNEMQRGDERELRQQQGDMMIGSELTVVARHLTRIIALGREQSQLALPPEATALVYLVQQCARDALTAVNKVRLNDIT